MTGAATSAETARIAAPVVDLRRGADGPRLRQVLYGDTVTVLERSETHCLVRADKDGYLGTLPASTLAPVEEATHKVTLRATHAYAAPDLKSPDRAMLPFGARVTALSETATFVETALGHIPRQHLHRIGAFADDPAAVAEIFLGTPYLWGGNSHLGIDCSGLVQAACLACGIACPGDSGDQAKLLGTPLDEGAALKRNDLIFWTGHVALLHDADTIIHANAGHMATVLEPISSAIARIETQGGGRPSVRKRLILP